MSHDFVCPNCGRRTAVSEGASEATCSACRRTFEADADGTSPSARDRSKTQTVTLKPENVTGKREQSPSPPGAAARKVISLKRTQPGDGTAGDQNEQAAPEGGIEAEPAQPAQSAGYSDQSEAKPPSPSETVIVDLRAQATKQAELLVQSARRQAEREAEEILVRARREAEKLLNDARDGSAAPAEESRPSLGHAPRLAAALVIGFYLVYVLAQAGGDIVLQAFTAAALAVDVFFLVREHGALREARRNRKPKQR